ncbi:MAG: hypothetical protein ACLQME_11030 [Alphaproteobacteria bacterium]
MTLAALGLALLFFGGWRPRGPSPFPLPPDQSNLMLSIMPIAKKPDIRCLCRPLDFDLGDNLAALDEVANGSPRAAAIAATALVEDALRWCLCGFLIPGFDEAELFDEPRAPLRSFHAKIEKGHALGIYGQVTRNDLHTMKEIRNAFAHSPRAVTFETPNIREHCLALSYVDVSRAKVSMPSSDTDARGKFVTTARLLLIDLHAVGFPESAYAKDVGGMP